MTTSPGLVLCASEKMENKADESYSKNDGRGKENKHIQIITHFSKCYEVSVGS